MLGCNSCARLGCGDCPLGDTGLGWMVPIRMPKAPTSAPTAPAGSSWWESILGTVSDIAKYGAEAAKVALPAYAAAKGFKAQMKQLRVARKAGVQFTPQEVSQIIGQPLANLPYGKDLSMIADEFLKMKYGANFPSSATRRADPAWELRLPGILPWDPGAMPKPNARVSLEPEKKFDVQKALPWIVGAAGLGLVVVVLLVKK